MSGNLGMVVNHRRLRREAVGFNRHQTVPAVIPTTPTQEAEEGSLSRYARLHYVPPKLALFGMTGG